MSWFARTRARRVEALPEHPCGSRFPGITGESEAMLRLKASILKAAAWDSLGCSPESGGNPDGRTYTRVEGNARAA